MPYTGFGLNHSSSTARGPGRLAKRQTLNTSDSRNHTPKNSAKPTSIRYGVGLFAHFDTRYMNMSHAPISPADVACLMLAMSDAGGFRGTQNHHQSLRQLAGRVIVPPGY